jgi:signal transduction histidine kinase
MHVNHQSTETLEPVPGPVTGDSDQRIWPEVLKHTLVWLIIFLLPYLVRLNYSEHFLKRNAFAESIFNVDTGLKLIWVVVFYLNAFLFVPLLFSRKKYLLYGLVVLALFCLVILLHNSLMNVFFTERGTLLHFREDGGGAGISVTKRLPELYDSIQALRDTIVPLSDEGPRLTVSSPAGGVTRAVPARWAYSVPFPFFGVLTFNLAPYSLTIAAGILFRMLRDKARADKLARLKQEENLKTELSFLRSQVSPHFLFNVLNNITALARKKSEELEPTIVKLSSLMRYMLYEANEERVLLKTEVEYLNSYIELQRQRFGDKVAISVRLNSEEEPDARIEPMLLIPFVENAFKHGVGFIHRPFIDISLMASGGNLVFQVNNKCNKDDSELKDIASGIGLANVRRRLNLLYREAHTLEIHKETVAEDNIRFSITLHVKLH